MDDNFRPRLASEYTDAEKIAAFDQLHKQSLEQFEEVCSTGNFREDNAHCFFESCMELLVKNNKEELWEAFNKHIQ